MRHVCGRLRAHRRRVRAQRLAVHVPHVDLDGLAVVLHVAADDETDGAALGVRADEARHVVAPQLRAAIDEHETARAQGGRGVRAQGDADVSLGRHVDVDEHVAHTAAGADGDERQAASAMSDERGVEHRLQLAGELRRGRRGRSEGRQRVVPRAPRSVRPSRAVR